MELRHLRYFVAAAEEQHFGRAAERLNITRPAVSQLIADLESEIGTLLFERQAHQVRLTAAGKTLLPRLQSMMKDLNQALATAKQVGEGKSGTLAIGYGSLSLIHPIFRSTVQQFRSLYPEVALSLQELPTSRQIEALATGKLDAGFLHLGPPVEGRTHKSGIPAHKQDVLETLSIDAGKLGVIVPSGHPLARRQSVTLAELANEDFVIVPRSSVSPDYGQLQKLCKKAEFEPKIVQEVNTIATQINLISVGLGIGLTVLSRHFVYPDAVAVIRLENIDYQTDFVLAWPRGRVEPALQNLIDTVKELRDEQIHEHAAVS